VKNSEHFWIDIGLKHYAIYQDDAMKIKSILPVIFSWINDSQSLNYSVTK